MSTISLPHENQIRHFFVADAIASETTIATFISGASIGEVQIFDTNGNAFNYSNAPANGGDFYIAKVNQKGSISKSDFITPKDVTYLKGTAPAAKLGKVQTFTLTSDPTVGTEYRVMAKIHYHNSEENFITFVVGDKAVTGDTKQTLLSRLAKQLSDNLANSINTSSKNPSTVTVGGTAAAGSVSLDSGASGSVDTVTVGGVSLIDSAVAFDTSLTVTAANLAAAINAKVTSPNYTATSAAGLVTITAVDPGVNTATVASTSTTIVTTDTNLGGVVVGTSIQTSNTNKYFKIGAAGSSLTITEKDWILEDFKVGLRTNDQLMWNFEMQGTDAVMANVTKSATSPVYAKGQGYQLIELERYLVGHRAEFETRDITLAFNRAYDISVNSSYYVLDLKYFDISRDDPKHSNKMLTIASTSALVIDAIGFAIEAQMGFAEGVKWAELDPNADGADNA